MTATVVPQVEPLHSLVVAPAGFVATPAPRELSQVKAKANLAQFIGGLLSGDTFLQDGALIWVQRGTADEVGYTGPIGAGWQPTLVYRFLFTRADSLATWLALVDARNGQILRFVDANDYAAVLKASVLTETNCSDPSNCVPGTAGIAASTAGTCGGNAPVQLTWTPLRASPSTGSCATRSAAASASPRSARSVARGPSSRTPRSPRA